MKKMEDIMKIVKSLDDSGSLIKAGTKTIKNETKKKKDHYIRSTLH